MLSNVRNIQIFILHCINLGAGYCVMIYINKIVRLNETYL